MNIQSMFAIRTIGKLSIMLHWATTKKSLIMDNFCNGIIKLMLYAGAHVKRQGKGGDTLLHYAAKNN